MKRFNKKAVPAAALGILLPVLSYGQSEVQAFHTVLDRLYDDMMPLCSQFIGVGRGIAAFAALWYIASRVYRQLASAEPLDVYPLLRPFALGMAIMFFPQVLALINGVLSPIVSGTSSMVESSNRSIEVLLKKKEESVWNATLWKTFGKEDTDDGRYADDGDDSSDTWETMKTAMSFTMNAAYYSFKSAIKVWLSEILNVVYLAASLCINTIRTFYLIVLSILGPLVMGLSVFDGFQNSFTIWLARYVNVFLWLPIANLFGAIIAKLQENMLQMDLDQLAKYGDTFFSLSDVGYLLFLIIGTVGYFCIPSVANSVVNVAGGHTILAKTNILSVATGSAVGKAGKYAAGKIKAGYNKLKSGSSGNDSSAASHGRAEGNTGSGSSYQKNKLSGNSGQSVKS